MNILSVTEFEVLKPAEKRKYLHEIFRTFNEKVREGKSLSTRNGQTQGYAFLWVSLYGKDKVSRAFRSLVKRETGKLFSNYRGSKNAWYFGSQSDLGLYDGLNHAAKWLANEAKIECFLCDEWD